MTIAPETRTRIEAALRNTTDDLRTIAYQNDTSAATVHGIYVAIMGGKDGHGRRVMPTDFPAVAPTLLLAQARVRWRCGADAAKRWAAQAGVSFLDNDRSETARRAARTLREKAPPPPSPPPPAPSRVPSGNLIHAVEAQRFMQGQGWVCFRVNDEGSASIGGNFFRLGTVVLTAAALIARAERRGWDANSWRRAA